MLKSVTVAHGFVDLGQLAEAAIYFPHTRQVVTSHQLADLIKVFGWDRLHAFLDVADVDFIADRHIVGSMNEGELISVGAVCKAGVGRFDYDDVEEELQTEIRRKLGITKANDRELQRLLPRLDMSSNEFEGGDSINRDMTDVVVTTAIANQFAEELHLPRGTYYAFEPASPTIGLFGNAWRPRSDFFDLAPEWTIGNPVAGPEVIGRSIYAATREVVRSADGRTDLWLPPEASIALRAKIDILAEALDDRRRDVEIFEEIAFKKRSIGAAMRSGRQSVDDLLDLLSHPETARWKSWLRAQPAEARLITAYGHEVFAPNKRFDSVGWEAGRILGMTGVSALLATVTGGLSLVGQIALSAVQEAGVTLGSKAAARLVEPWRPSQWVKGPAERFLSPG